MTWIPTVSVNLCCYNSEKYVRKTMDSIVGQTYKDWELVVINDGSSDATESILREYIDCGYPIVYQYQENRGLGYSRNKALQLSRGEFVAFIDSDDIWLLDKLEKQVEVFSEHPEADFLYSNYYKIIMPDENKLILGNKNRQPQGNVFEQFLYHYPVYLVTTLVRRSALAHLDQGFDEKLTLAEEFDVFMRVLYKSLAIYIHEPLAIYRIHSDMGSIRHIERYPQENAYVLDKLVKVDTLISSKHENAIQYFKGKISYWEARTLMINGKSSHARAKLKPYRALDYRFFLLYIMTYFPEALWTYVHGLKDKGIIKSF